MEEINNTAGLIDLLERPAFCVRNGMILQTNPAASRLMIPTGVPVADLITTSLEDYQAFDDGFLYLTVSVNGHSCGASVTKINGFHIFAIEEPADREELAVMALAAQELREPLANVMAIADRLFPMAATENDPVLQDQIARINRGLFQMLRVIGNMSDAARYSKPDNTPKETRDITALLDEVFRRAAELVEHAGIQIHFTNLSRELYCLVDEEKIERAVYNIISNAVKFTPKGGTIHAKLSRHENRLHLTLQDSGQGICPELRSNIYTRYLRGPGIEDSRFGIGLGMVLVRSAAAAHGGTVLLEQPENSGTRITMTMEIRQGSSTTLRSNILRVDYAGERDHGLIELSDCLPAFLYEKNKIN
jgi:signal transduction histidine kinase